VGDGELDNIVCLFYINLGFSINYTLYPMMYTTIYHLIWFLQSEFGNA
jgi:hypothetical protein